MPNLGFYSHQPWMQPVPPHFPYPIPYIPGYPGFVVPPQQTFTSSAASDAGGPVTGMQNAWGHVGGMYTVRLKYPFHSLQFV
jgi:hypothetical protein